MADRDRVAESCPFCGCPGEKFDGHVCEDYAPSAATPRVMKAVEGVPRAAARAPRWCSFLGRHLPLGACDLLWDRSSEFRRWWGAARPVKRRSRVATDPMTPLRKRTIEISEEYWATREKQSERVAVAQMAFALARVEGELAQANVVLREFS